jgi:hypothetical protein
MDRDGFGIVMACLLRRPRDKMQGRQEANMIELTQEQREALQKGTGPVRALDRATNTEYVLVRADVYDWLTHLLADETVYASAEMLDRVMAEDDANDPYLAELQTKYQSHL